MQTSVVLNERRIEVPTTNTGAFDRSSRAPRPSDIAHRNALVRVTLPALRAIRSPGVARYGGG